MDILNPPTSLVAPSILLEGSPDRRQFYALNDAYQHIENHFQMLYQQQMLEALNWMFEQCPDVEEVGLVVIYRGREHDDEHQLKINGIRYDRSHFYGHTYENFIDKISSDKVSVPWYDDFSEEQQERIRLCAELLSRPFGSEDYKKKAVERWKYFLYQHSSTLSMQRHQLPDLRDYFFTPEYQAQLAHAHLNTDTPAMQSATRKPRL